MRGDSRDTSCESQALADLSASTRPVYKAGEHKPLVTSTLTCCIGRLYKDEKRTTSLCVLIEFDELVFSAAESTIVGHWLTLLESAFGRWWFLV